MSERVAFLHACVCARPAILYEPHHTHGCGLVFNSDPFISAILITKLDEMRNLQLHVLALHCLDYYASRNIPFTSFYNEHNQCTPAYQPYTIVLCCLQSTLCLWLWLVLTFGYVLLYNNCPYSRHNVLLLLNILYHHYWASLHHLQKVMFCRFLFPSYRITVDGPWWRGAWPTTSN